MRSYEQDRENEKRQLEEPAHGVWEDRAMKQVPQQEQFKVTFCEENFKIYE